MNAEASRDLRVLVVDHTSALGGGELAWLDVDSSGRFKFDVALLEEGPFAARLRERGVRVTVIGKPWGLGAMRRSKLGLGALLALPGFARWIVRLMALFRGYDVVVANSQKAFVASALAAALTRVPLAWYLHDILSREHFGSLQMGLVTRLANGCAGRVLANSRASADAFVARGGKACLVRVVHVPVDARPFTRRGEVSAARSRVEQGLPEAFTVGLFGRIASWKGQAVLIRALRDVPGAHALIVGAPLFGEDAEAAALNRLVSESGLAERVALLGFRDDIAPLMSACDVIVHASTSPEPFGRVIVEGQLAGRPVVATEGGGASEIVVHAATGWLVRAGDHAGLARALIHLRDDPQLRSRLAAQGRESALASFQNELVAGRIFDELRSIARS